MYFDNNLLPVFNGTIFFTKNYATGHGYLNSNHELSCIKDIYILRQDGS